uniref:Uncharacterized protein n=1 Tax=Oryza barthii TaxID=65489 RepID=A0A0D3H9P5_9ORYZ
MLIHTATQTNAKTCRNLFAGTAAGGHGAQAATPCRPTALHELQRLRASSCSSPAASALVALGGAYGRVEELVRLPSTTSSRRDGDDAPWRRAAEEEALDATSARRRRPRDAAGTSLFASTEAQRLLRCLTKVTRNASNAKKKVVAGKRSLAAQNETPPAVKALSEAMAATVAVLRGVATSLYGRIVDTKKRRWD